MGGPPWCTVHSSQCTAAVHSAQRHQQPQNLGKTKTWVSTCDPLQNLGDKKGENLAPRFSMVIRVLTTLATSVWGHNVLNLRHVVNLVQFSPPLYNFRNKK